MLHEKFYFCRKCILVLHIATFSVCLPVMAQVQFPSNPTSTAQCDSPYEKANALSQQHHNQGALSGTQAGQVDRQGWANCRGLSDSYNNRQWSQCINPYTARSRQLYDIASQHYRERDRIQQEARQLKNHCYQIAKAHEQQADNQRRVAEENQRRQHEAQLRQRAEAERQQREAERQQQLTENQRRHEEAERRQLAANARAREEAQQRYLEQQARQSGARAAEQNQPRVVGQIPQNSYSNEPRITKTPDYAAQAQAAAARAQEERKLAEAQALRDTLSNAASTFRHPQNSNVNQQLTRAGLASETNTAINAGRGGSPVAGAIGSSALATAGAKTAESLNQFNQASKQIDRFSTNDAPRPSAPQTPRSVAAYAPHQSDSLSNATTQPGLPASPKEACGKRVFLSLARCMAKQCEKGEYKSHAQCNSTQANADP